MTKFYELSPQLRLKALNDAVTAQDITTITTAISQSQLEICNNLSENVIGGYVLPLAIVPDVTINNLSYNIPMVTEETSVVAAINKMAKLINACGKISTSTSKNIGIGQIHITNAKPNTIDLINIHHKSWQEFANNNMLKSMRARGGGMIEICTKNLSNNNLVINCHIDTCDAMGANIINQTLEELAPIIKNDLQCDLGIKILSNLTDKSLTTATIEITLEESIAEAIVEAYEFAAQDPYRACTHNKGIMNGIDAVLIATGNDWRAVEAAMHTFAQQKPMSSWKIKNNTLIGELKAPINVGICGGITKVQPLAKTCLNILKVKSAPELAGIIAAIGLMQNLAALLALATKGICNGHMRLHIKNIIKELELDGVEAQTLTKVLTNNILNGKKITITSAKNELKKIRANI